MTLDKLMVALVKWLHEDRDACQDFCLKMGGDHLWETVQRMALVTDE